MRLKIVALMVGAAFLLSACESTGPKQQSGALIGAGIGGVIGSQFGGSTGGRLAAGVLGAGIGGLIGGGIGAKLDAEDRARLNRITTASVRSGRSGSFRNAKTGVRGSTQVVQTKNANGQLCRTVQQNVTLNDGTTSTDRVTGCKGPNGWSV